MVETNGTGIVYGQGVKRCIIDPCKTLISSARGPLDTRAVRPSRAWSTKSVGLAMYDSDHDDDGKVPLAVRLVKFTVSKTVIWSDEDRPL